MPTDQVTQQFAVGDVAREVKREGKSVVGQVHYVVTGVFAAGYLHPKGSDATDPEWQLPETDMITVKKTTTKGKGSNGLRYVSQFVKVS
jgi:hypothetical protein